MGAKEGKMAQKTRGRFDRILFPTDFTAASIDAAAYALKLAKQNRAKLYVLHVVDTGREAAGFYLPHLSYEKLDQELMEAAREMIADFTAKTFRGYKDTEQHVLKGEPYKEILKVIRGMKIDLTVMGTFGKARIDRIFFGSTTERVMRKARCPVLIIPPSK